MTNETDPATGMPTLPKGQRWKVYVPSREGYDLTVALQRRIWGVWRNVIHWPVTVHDEMSTEEGVRSLVIRVAQNLKACAAQWDREAAEKEHLERRIREVTGIYPGRGRA